MDIKKSWQEFQRYCETREKRDADQPHTPVRKVQKRLIAVVAAVAAAIALMLTAQAAGVDVFGTIAHWTDDVFSITWGGRGTPEQPEWAEALIEQGIDANLIPATIPDGYIAGELTVDDFGVWKAFYQPFRSTDDELLYIKIIFYSGPECIQTSAYEKDKSLVEIYEYGQGKIYTFSNINEGKAIYLDGLAEVCVAGSLSLEELKQILESMGMKKKPFYRREEIK